MDPFERSVKRSLDQYEVPYNSADWSEMEGALSGVRGSWWSSAAGYIALILAGLLVVGGGGYLMLRTDDAGKNAGTGTEKADLAPGGNGDRNDRSTGTSLTTAEGAKDRSAENDILNAATEEGSSIRNSGAIDTNDPTPGSASRSAPLANTKAGLPGDKGTSGSKMPGTGPSNANGDTNAGSSAFKASISQGCEGSSVEFKVGNDLPEGSHNSYLWNFGDGTFSNKIDPSHTYTKAGKFTVSLSVSTPGGGTRKEPYTDMIVIHEVPQASFNVMPQEFAGHVPFVHFENRSLGGTKYHWNFGDGTTSAIAHPDHVYREAGTYRIQLMVMNDLGCTDFVEKEFRVDSDYNLLAPAAFSPNGDGNQDQFMPQALRDLNVKFKLSIYEPGTGRLVYETNDASRPWSGRFMNRSELCADGDYVWMVEIQEGLYLGEVTYEGKVSLLR